MSDLSLLEKLLCDLKDLQATIRDTAEPSVSERLDQVVFEMEALIENSEENEDAARIALISVGKFLGKLPAILSILDRFSD